LLALLPLATLLAVSTANAAAPVATNGTASTTEDTSVTTTLSATDADGGNLTYSVSTNPAHGTVSISGTQATYTPTANYNGSDSFTWRARDSTLQYSNTATTTLSISAVNDAPTAISQSTTTPVGTAVSITLGGSDPEGSALSCARTTSPTHGRTSYSGCTATYTPDAFYSGADAFTFTVSDGSLTSAAATLSKTVATNPAPTPNAQSV
jgi:hypothetical protein